MKWKFINTWANNGKFNMDYDIKLAKNFKSDTAVLRLYKWNPYCISLGANQSFSNVLIEKAKFENIDVVKRPTGGRAILHSEELTYSVIYPIEKITSAQTVYNEINLALQKGLIEFDERLNEIGLEHHQPDFKEFYKSDISTICFAVSAKCELNYKGKKLVGSAQRKLGNVILQHGSILGGEFHKKIVDYLNFNDTTRTEVLNEISDTTIDLKSALNYEIDYSKLAKAIRKGFENHFKIEFDEVYIDETENNFMVMK